jgi:O-antigen ligase
MARLCQLAIFAIVQVILIASPLAFGATRWWALGPLLGLIWLGVAFWIARILLLQAVPVIFSAIGAPVLLCATYVIVRYGLVDAEPLARTDVFVAVGATLLFFLILNNLRHRWQITVLVWTWAILGGIIALYGISQVVGLTDRVWQIPQFAKYRGQASGTFINPSHCAAYLQLVFPLVLANFLFSRRRFAHKLVLFFSGLLIVAGLLLSFADGAWLGWLASLFVLAVYIIRRRGSKFRWAVIGGSVLGVVIVVALMGLQIVRQRAPGKGPETVQYRLPLWRSAWTVARQSPLLGVGPGMFQWQFPSQRTLQQQPGDANNEYLNLFAEYGLIGALLVVWALVAFTVSTVRILLQRAARYSAATPSNRFAFAVGGLAALAAALVNMVFGNTLHAPANLFTLVAIMAAVLTCGVHHHGEDDEDSAKAGHYAPLRFTRMTKFLLAGSLALVLLIFSPRLLKTCKTHYFFDAAERARQALNWDAAELGYRHALAADRRNFEAAGALGDLFAARATWNRRQQSAFASEALRWYAQAHTTNPYGYGVLIKMARVYDLLDKRELAAERLGQALKFDPHNASYHVQLGLHHLRWGQTAEALAAFREAQRWDGDPQADALARHLDESES